MKIIILIVVSILWSFVPILVKGASLGFSNNVITFSRFFFGVIFLFAFIMIKERKIKIYWKEKWIWYGAIAKCINYIFENLAISMGYAFMGILTFPILVLFLLIVSVTVLGEKIRLKTLIAAILGIIGIFLVSWNGSPLESYISTNGLIIILFTLSGIGAGIHQLSQKALIKKMDSGNMNLSVFLWCSIITVFPVPIAGNAVTQISLISILSLIGLGFITGASFYLYAIALKKVPLLIAIIIVNSCVLFTILWSYLIFREPITIYVLTGAIIFIIGIIIINLPNRKLIITDK